MASLMELLLDTMPMAAAKNALSRYQNKEFKDLQPATARRLLRFLDPGESLQISVPALNPALTTATQPLWSWRHDAAEPATVRDVYGRVRDADYVAHKVVDHLSWGLEEPVGTLNKNVKVSFAAGGQVLLPLSKEYVFWKVLVKGGKISPDQTPLWKLESVIDSSLVVAFVYDIDPASGKVQPADLSAIKDPKAKDDWDQVQRAVTELMGSPGDGLGGARGSDAGTGGVGGAAGSGEEEAIGPLVEPSTAADAPESASSQDSATAGPPPDPDQAPTEPETWGERVSRGDIFWRPGWEPKVAPAGTPSSIPMVRGQVGEVHDVSTGPAVVVILVSFAFCCERADFEAGGIVGFARCYPHLMVRANVALDKVEASIQIDRPRKLTRMQEPGRDMSKTCCKPGYDDWTDDIRGLLVADANTNDTHVGPPLPFWSNMFSYVLEDPFSSQPMTKLHVVRTDIDHDREIDGYFVRNLAPNGSYTSTQKEAFQGAFDNVHIAPRLKLVNAAKVRGPIRVIPLFVSETDHEEDPLWDRDFIPVVPLTDTSALHLDRIAMAPFCAHDCLHMHWRWPTHATSKWVLGWSENGPYAEPGRPLVPRGQDVWLWFRSDSAITYHVRAKIPGPSAYEWCVLMHHGFGHAVSIVDKWTFQTAMMSVSAMQGDYELQSEQGVSITPENSTAAYYWNARYQLVKYDGKFVATERLYAAKPGALQRVIDF